LIKKVKPSRYSENTPDTVGGVGELHQRRSTLF
jgi:hypothetical protein